MLVPNFLHHWDRATIQNFLGKVHAVLAPTGQIVVVEFVPNEDRVSPPVAAGFVLNMLANTPGGDCYPARNTERCFVRLAFLVSRFTRCCLHHTARLLRISDNESKTKGGQRCDISFGRSSLSASPSQPTNPLFEWKTWNECQQFLLIRSRASTSIS